MHADLSSQYHGMLLMSLRPEHTTCPRPRSTKDTKTTGHQLTIAQVLYKRKPVQYLPRPVIEDESSEVLKRR